MQQHYASNIIKRVAKQRSWSDYYDQQGRGRIWINQVLDFVPLVMNEQFIYGQVMTIGLKLWITAIYDLHNIGDSRRLWSVLGTLVTNMQEPWL